MFPLAVSLRTFYHDKSLFYSRVCVSISVCVWQFRKWVLPCFIISPLCVCVQFNFRWSSQQWTNAIGNHWLRPVAMGPVRCTFQSNHTARPFYAVARALLFPLMRSLVRAKKWLIDFSNFDSPLAGINRFLVISQFLERVIMEHIDSKIRYDFEATNRL